LFGHEKGAFTNAVSRRIGRFEEASGGTLFLDEIGELAAPLQSKLLRGGSGAYGRTAWQHTPVPVDLRLVTATSRNLEEAVQEGEFREDLYYRLQRRDDSASTAARTSAGYPALVEHFLHREEERPLSHRRHSQS